MKRFRAFELIALGVVWFAQSNFAQDPNLSNGTCYYQAGAVANSRYIPCGNAALGNFTCCEGLDMCISSNACYNGRWGVTYLAGCSDPTYEDESCPDKRELSAQEWVGLSLCAAGSDGLAEWVLCDNADSNSNTVTSALPCSCPSPSTSATFAFTAPTTLANDFRLPASAGETMCPPNSNSCPYSTPSAALTSSTSTRSSPSARSTSITSSKITSSTTQVASTSAPKSTSASQTSFPIPTSSESGLSTGAKAGIGAGVALGCCLALAVVGCIYIRRRKRRQLADEDTTIRPRSGVIAVEKDPSEELNQRSPAWSGNISELGGGDRGSGSLVSPLSSQGTWTRPTSAEVEGSVPTYQSIGNVRAQALGGIGPAYKPYRKAEAPPIGVHEVNANSVAPRVVRQPEGRPGSGVFEIPAQVPGSTLPY